MRQQAILLISDGENQPPLSDSGRTALLAKAEAFKTAGGIVLCVGVRAAGDGFSLLKQLASGGFFLNVLPGQDVAEAVDTLKGLLGYYCAGELPPFNYGLGCGDCLVRDWNTISGSFTHDGSNRIIVEFSPAQEFNRVAVACSGLVPPLWPVEGSNDGVNWVDLGAVSANDCGLGDNPCMKLTNAGAYSSYRIPDLSDGNPLALSFGRCETFACLDEPLGAQMADPVPLPTSEQGDMGGGGGGPVLPILPKVVFSPASGVVGSGLSVTLSVPGFPTAQIKYSLGQGSIPADPSFAYPSGTDYNGVSVTIPQAGLTEDSTLKAVAHLAGYDDSVVATMTYPSGRSNNTDTVIINDRGSGSVAAKATTYPSVKYVSGVTGSITNIKLELIGFRHMSPDDVHIMLEGPDGTTVEVIRNAGGINPVASLNINFSEAGGPLIPDSGTMTSGDFSPSKYGVELDYPSPAPAGPYGGAMTAFVGKNPNGAWKLWVVDDTALDDGLIANGWDLVITAA